jgi:hypothetical protein
VTGARVVKGGQTLDVQGHPATDGSDVTHQAVANAVAVMYRHEVQNLGDSLRREEAGEEHVRVREIQLLAATVALGLGLEIPTLLVVQDRAEYAWRVEGGQAQPVDRPIRPDERRRMQIAYYPVVLDRKVSHPSTGPRGRRRS